jgi:hypothetical protein
MPLLSLLFFTFTFALLQETTLMMHLGSLILMSISRYLSSRMHSHSHSSSSPQCVVCNTPTTRQTTCCKTPLCAEHMEAWLADRRPCPCKQR